MTEYVTNGNEDNAFEESIGNFCSSTFCLVPLTQNIARVNASLVKLYSNTELSGTYVKWNFEYMKISDFFFIRQKNSLQMQIKSQDRAVVM